MGVTVEYLFFIGYQLVALSSVGKIGVWHAMTRNWQTQDVLPIASFDTAGSFLLLGCTNGSIYYIDMQKFPLRMKDNDLLVTELYHDPSNDVITAISVYLTPKTNVCGNWIEIAYGTSSGTVRVIVQHPETVGHGPQLFQTFTVHRHPVTKVRLSEKLLISVCCEYNHVRTWSVMRFRGMISTQPGSTPLSSYKILTLEEADQPALCVPHANEIGPYGEQDDEQVFIQKVVPETEDLIVRLASKGKRVCSIKSVDGSGISGFCVHECDGRIGSTRPRRYLFTGHTSGAIQMWDLTTALDMVNKAEPEEDGSPSPAELMRMLEHCDLSYSRGTTPCVSPSPHLLQHWQQSSSNTPHYNFPANQQYPISSGQNIGHHKTSGIGQPQLANQSQDICRTPSSAQIHHYHQSCQPSASATSSINSPASPPHKSHFKTTDSSYSRTSNGGLDSTSSNIVGDRAASGTGCSNQPSNTSAISSFANVASGSGKTHSSGLSSRGSVAQSQFLKPANVAFLSHHQNSGGVRPKEDKEDEGTPC